MRSPSSHMTRRPPFPSVATRKEFIAALRRQPDARQLAQNDPSSAWAGFTALSKHGFAVHVISTLARQITRAEGIISTAAETNATARKIASFPFRENPEPPRVRPSLDARFRGHDTDVSESSPPF